MADTYTVVRKYFKGESKTLKIGLTLEEAQEHCEDPETSSNTATDPDREPGVWFDCYCKE